MDIRPHNYQPKTVESKWIDIWSQSGFYTGAIAQNSHGDTKSFYNLMMFPYPSAEGLHIGNMYAFTGSDIYGRFKRMQRFNVFEPIGLDGFGIHSENYALKIGKHPMDHAKVTEKKYYNQLHRIGAMFDWTRTVETYDPGYYRWTQWLFVQMFKHGLAYRDKAQVNWCPGCKTVLADEQVVAKKATILSDPPSGGESKDPNGSQGTERRLVIEVVEDVCERCGNKVEKRLLKQWFFRITAYAEKLLQNSFSLNWSEKIRVTQQNWIGKKEGINITYSVVTKDGQRVGEITCFTTRPDTNFGATFVAIAPEHRFVSALMKLVTHEKKIEIQTYIDQMKNKDKQGRSNEDREKTGVNTGLYCINGLNNYKMPLYISDFVLVSFGSGAVVGVPGHDKRDFEFAKYFNIPIVRVVVGSDGEIGPITSIDEVQEEEGKMIHSEFLDGQDIHEATKTMMDYLEKNGMGKRVSTYHLRDWLISRQRYWGPPIPMIYCDACNKKNQGERKEMPGWYSVPEDKLPVELPYIEDYKPGDDGIAPLAKHKEFYETTCPGCGEKAVRETDVSDTFLDSSWYFLRYPSVGFESKIARKQESKKDIDGVSERSGSLSETSLPAKRASSSQSLPWDPAITKLWLPVHMYTGGAEHSVLHLMYSRFVTMALHDFGYLDFEEPFSRFYAHGLVIKDGAKMSKSKGNVINPDEYIDRYGADAVRLYLMFMGPFDQGGDFRDTAMEGMSRWVGRVWRLVQSVIVQQSKSSRAAIQSALQDLIIKVTEDIEKRRYNTAIASMMEFTNLVSDEGGQLSLGDANAFVRLLAPFAPFITEELWFQLHRQREPLDNKAHKDIQKEYQSIHLASWPVPDRSKIQSKDITIVIQVNGKVRDTLTIDKEIDQKQSEIELMVKKSPKAEKFLTGKTIKRVVFVPGKLINFVI